MAKEDLVNLKRKELLEKLEKIKGKKLGEIDTSHILDNSKNKGAAGQVIQKYLGKDLDSNPDADFPEANLELKVTGLSEYQTKDKGAFHAKERLVLTMINYMEDYNKTFEESHLLNKCNDLLVTCYQYITSRKGEKPDYKSFPIVDSFIMELSEKDEDILRKDYEIILNKIRNGQAHTISESDTTYLQACTKSSNNKKRTPQPFSEETAKPRAFCLKSSFFTSLIRYHISDTNFNSIIEDINKFKETTLEDMVISKFKPYFGKTEEELGYELGIQTNAKNRFAAYANRIFKTKNLEESDEFLKANISIKTIRIQKTGSIKEKLSFPQIDFVELANTSWEESETRQYFCEIKFLFLIFKETNKGYVFDNAFFYSLTDDLVDEFIGYTYNKAKETLNSGKIVNKISKSKNGKITYYNNFVGMKENPICHIRPHAKNFNDQKPLPFKDEITGFKSYEKMSFWIDTRLIKARIENKDQEYIEEAREKLKK